MFNFHLARIQFFFTKVRYFSMPERTVVLPVVQGAESDSRLARVTVVIILRLFRVFVLSKFSF